MDARQLKIFLTVCEEGSLTKAAQRLYVSQQALSKSITHLEAELGVSLLTRTRQGVVPTTEGLVLRDQSKAYLAFHDQILDRMREEKDHDHVLRIGFFMGFLQELPPHFLSSFMRSNPELHVRLYSYADNARSRNARSFDCDLMFSTSTLTSGRFEQIAHTQVPLGVLMHRTHPLAPKQSIELADLQGQQMITLSSESLSQLRLLEVLRHKGLVPRAVLGDTDLELQHDLINDGYIAFYAGKRSTLPPEICFRPVDDLNVCWEFHVYKRRGHVLHSATEQLVKDVLQATKPD